MVLNVNNQLDLLYDLLSLHAEECCGSSSECEQISRLIKSIQQHPNMDNNLYDVINGIDQYGNKGAISNNLDDHIHQHQTDIQQWLQVIKDANH
ncbi:hypothetical protein JCM21714_1911 [Gracilibacillus boraciitolerans JCM 21714]|uniref:YtzH-like protein n=1 Tax=Gracilibacillus boraciitolerans JCM 21714 TaxID=1298598 RepID=W4VJ96_9BACI|nr:YtzH-like family protein [Gracilibacillus boraciitolerans]GAE92888.1 hypothetical protein JCM21714_1911 [Gracilibacillus boraciitolerans JCM 21714]